MGQYWVQPMVPFLVADGAAVTGAVLTELSPTPQVVIPAPMLNEFAGKKLSFQAAGFYTTSATAGTFNWGIYIGAAGAIGSMTAIGTTGLISYVVSQTNRAWRLEGEVQIRTVGSSGTCIAMGDVSNATSGAKDMLFTAAAGTAAIDTTSARAIALGITPSAAQSVTCRYFNVQLQN